MIIKPISMCSHVLDEGSNDFDVNIGVDEGERSISFLGKSHIKQ